MPKSITLQNGGRGISIRIGGFWYSGNDDEDAAQRGKEGPMHTRDEIRLTTLAACAG
jgi:hypothetical protein